MNIITSTINAFKDFLFLTQCFHCGASLSDNEERICRTCWESLTPVCSDDYTFTVMTDRFRAGGIVDEFVPLYYFEKGKVLQHLAHALKYEEISRFGYELGIQIGHGVQGMGCTAELIIPVPLNKRKERERGYNQSDFIARGVAHVLGLPVLPTAVKRVKYTVTQTHLNADQRKENIADAFIVHPKYTGRIKDASVMIVDDIITTGSTIQELGRVLKENGALKIIAASAGLAKLGEDG
ncbi:MAG: ComF family protein [Bacteroidota bacterium]